MIIWPFEIAASLLRLVINVICYFNSRFIQLLKIVMHRKCVWLIFLFSFTCDKLTSFKEEIDVILSYQNLLISFVEVIAVDLRLLFTFWYVVLEHIKVEVSFNVYFWVQAVSWLQKFGTFGGSANYCYLKIHFCKSKLVCRQYIMYYIYKLIIWISEIYVPKVEWLRQCK